MKSFFLRKILNPNLTVLIGPVLLLLGVAALFIVVINNGYSQIKSELNNLKTNRETQVLLKDKLEKLREISPGVLDSTSLVVTALPEKNPGLLMISQMRLFSTNNSLSFNKVELRNTSKLNDNLNKTEILGELGLTDYSSAVAFLKNIISTAPISSLENFSVEISKDNLLEAKVQVSTYWASLPKQLPALTESFQELTREEQATLTKVTNFAQPEYVILPPTSPRERINPFN